MRCARDPCPGAALADAAAAPQHGADHIFAEAVQRAITPPTGRNGWIALPRVQSGVDGDTVVEQPVAVRADPVARHVAHTMSHSPSGTSRDRPGNDDGVDLGVVTADDADSPRYYDVNVPRNLPNGCDARSVVRLTGSTAEALPAMHSYYFGDGALRSRATGNVKKFRKVPPTRYVTGRGSIVQLEGAAVRIVGIVDAPAVAAELAARLAADDDVAHREHADFEAVASGARRQGASAKGGQFTLSSTDVAARDILERARLAGLGLVARAAPTSRSRSAQRGSSAARHIVSDDDGSDDDDDADGLDDAVGDAIADARTGPSSKRARDADPPAGGRLTITDMLTSRSGAPTAQPPQPYRRGASVLRQPPPAASKEARVTPAAREAGGGRPQTVMLQPQLSRTGNSAVAAASTVMDGDEHGVIVIDDDDDEMPRPAGVMFPSAMSRAAAAKVASAASSDAALELLESHGGDTTGRFAPVATTAQGRSMVSNAVRPPVGRSARGPSVLRR